MKNFYNNNDITKIIKSLNINLDLLNKKNILITGAFGFIGKYILETLITLKKNNNIDLKIYALDNFITSNSEVKNYFEDKDIECFDHDICKEINIDLKFDYIVCLAGIASPYYYKKYPMETLNVSIDGFKNMFNLKHDNNSKFIFFSSSEIYGNPPNDQIPTKETFKGHVSSIGPRSCYDESKRLGETLCYIYSNFHDKKTAIIRPFNVYGPGMTLNDYRIIPNIARSIILDEELKVYDTGNQTRTYCYITDAITGFLKVIFKDEKFGVYNIGNEKNEISVLDLIKTTEKVMKIKINYKLSEYPKEYPPDEPLRRCPDINNAKNNLGYEPMVFIEEGLKKYFDWCSETYK
tara:strand:+ start:1371 stop:2420 length:1050 start_codon:yes stop_codon:yes gene_type:complete